MTAKILADSKICISVPLSKIHEKPISSIYYNKTPNPRNIYSQHKLVTPYPSESTPSVLNFGVAFWEKNCSYYNRVLLRHY